jgi:uncharacterized protein DUF6804
MFPSRRRDVLEVFRRLMPLKTMKRVAGLYVTWLVAAGLLVSAAVERHPYSFYTLLRWICCPVFAYSAFAAHEKNRLPWAWIFGALALVYNPIFRVHLDRSTWIGVNWLTVAVLVVAAIIFWRPSSKSAQPLVRRMARSTMTMQEAERILDIVSAALQDKSHPRGHPVSALQGYPFGCSPWPSKPLLYHDERSRVDVLLPLGIAFGSFLDVNARKSGQGFNLLKRAGGIGGGSGGGYAAFVDMFRKCDARDATFGRHRANAECRCFHAPCGVSIKRLMAVWDAY